MSPNNKLLSLADQFPDAFWGSMPRSETSKTGDTTAVPDATTAGTDSPPAEWTDAPCADDLSTTEANSPAPTAAPISMAEVQSSANTHIQDQGLATTNELNPAPLSSPGTEIANSLDQASETRPTPPSRPPTINRSHTDFQALISTFPEAFTQASDPSSNANVETGTDVAAVNDTATAEQTLTTDGPSHPVQESATAVRDLETPQPETTGSEAQKFETSLLETAGTPGVQEELESPQPEASMTAGTPETAPASRDITSGDIATGDIATDQPPITEKTDEGTNAEEPPPESIAAHPPDPSPKAPLSIPSKDYAQALQRHVHTFTWGQIEIYLTYGPERLQSIWITVGKSGTEVQSLCEAITRLINLLLAQGVPIATICHQIRGIRGADSEGLGPNRVLGLADLIGKALQEAPETYPGSTGHADAPQASPNAGSSDFPQPVEDIQQTWGGGVQAPKAGTAVTGTANDARSLPRTTEIDSAVSASTVTTTPLKSMGGMKEAPPAGAQTWLIPETSSLSAMLCPECGAELQHMNGCSGGACPVCGFSSCS